MNGDLRRVAKDAFSGTLRADLRGVSPVAKDAKGHSLPLRSIENGQKRDVYIGGGGPAADPSHPSQRFLAVDPGGRHCGWALFRGGRVDRFGTCEPGALLEDVWLHRTTGRGAVSLLVVEEFRLYPDKAPALAYDPLRVVEVIGALRWMAEVRELPVVLQPASIKRSAKAMCRRRGLVLRGDGHARDAQLHGYFYLWRCSHDRVR